MSDTAGMTVDEIGRLLKAEIAGQTNITIHRTAPLATADIGELTFCKSENFSRLEEYLKGKSGVVVIVPEKPSGDLIKKHTFIVVDKPRLAFVKISTMISGNIETAFPGISGKATIGENVELGIDVNIGPRVLIEDGVSIGDGTNVYSYTVIKSGTMIGKRVRIKTNVVIGEEAASYARDESGVLLHMSQNGGVIVGDDVDIGPGTVICRGVMENTRIGRGTKIDGKVWIAHNCTVGQDCILIAGAVVCGSVSIGDRCWIGPNATLSDHITIGADSVIGAGSVVLRDIPSGATVLGNPARFFRKTDKNTV